MKTSKTKMTYYRPYIDRFDRYQGMVAEDDKRLKFWAGVHPACPDAFVLASETESRIAELEAHIVAADKHQTAEEPGDLCFNEVTGLHAEADLYRIAELEARLKAMEQAYKEGITYGQYKEALGGDDGCG